MINGLPINNWGGTWQVPPYSYWNGVIDLVSDESDPKYPVELGEVKAFARVTSSAEDAIFTYLIAAASQAIEKYLNINLYNREITVLLNNPLGGVFLPYGPVTTPVADIMLTDEYGNVITDAKWSGTNWPQLLWPQYERIKATYNCGYDICPEQIRTAIKEEIVFLYRNRGEEELRSRSGGVVTLGLSSVAKTLLRSLKRS